MGHFVVELSLGGVAFFSKQRRAFFYMNCTNTRFVMGTEKLCLLEMGHFVAEFSFGGVAYFLKQRRVFFYMLLCGNWDFCAFLGDFGPSLKP